MADPEP